MRTININGVDFELTIPRKKVECVSGYILDEYAIFVWYDRPSVRKISIWREWLKWALDTNGIQVFEISSANCMQFSIKGLWIDPSTNKEYNLYITRDHNRAILVN